MNIQNILIQNIIGDVIISEGNSFTVLGGRSTINGGIVLVDGVEDDVTITVIPGAYNSVCIQNITGDVAISLNQSKVECLIVNNVSGDVSGKVHANTSVIERILDDCYLVVD